MTQTATLQNKTLLIELCTEELPPKALKQLGQSFAQGIYGSLEKQHLLNKTSIGTSYATPRRLAVSITHVLQEAHEQTVTTKILPITIALDAQGQPTPPFIKKMAALGFSHVPIEALHKQMDGKTESFFYTHTVSGIKLAEGLQKALDETLTQLPIPKVMTYQMGPRTIQEGSTNITTVENFQFVRPARSLLALHGEMVLPISALGLTASNTTLGHRFMGPGGSIAIKNTDVPEERPKKAGIEIKNADDYEKTLEEEGKVIASYEKRRQIIVDQLKKASEEITTSSSEAHSYKVLMPDALLDEVTALVEFPKVYVCQFDEAFLEVPRECLILTMQANQKYFALENPATEPQKELEKDPKKALSNRFLVVSNIDTKTPQEIIEGNQRVIRPRLADAKFFFEQDKKKTLAERVPDLGKVIYHNKLGTQLERVKRLQKISREIAVLLGANPDDAERAAYLCKADLLTDMVGEFPELQGTMGKYYAEHNGEKAHIAAACEEHYYPRFSGDRLPASLPEDHASTSIVLALADKLETLVGIWGIGLQPTGEKDPFALRRHALGIIRILMEYALPLDVQKLLEITEAAFSETPVALQAMVHETCKNPAQTPENHPHYLIGNIYAFLLDRLNNYLKDKGFSPQEIDAVLSQKPTQLLDVQPRLSAVKAFFNASPEAAALTSASKRIRNILKKNPPAAGSSQAFQENLLIEPAEKELAKLLPGTQKAVKEDLAAKNFFNALNRLSILKEDIDQFFNDVMVLADDTALRNNRLALLNQLDQLLNCVADISKLAQN